MSGYPDDPGLVRVLSELGVAPDALLGHGGEAWVYALDEARVVRVLHKGGSPVQLQANMELTEELSTPGLLPFELPRLLSVGEVDGRTYAIEPRLIGRSVLQELEFAQGSNRDHLVEAYLEAASILGEAPLQPRGYFGDLVSPEPVRAASWREYLELKAGVSLVTGGLLGHVDARALAKELPEPAEARFLHLDAFAGNMMTDGSRITAVLDLGPACVAGDPQLNAVAATVYLEAPQVTPPATSRDRMIARAWLRSYELLDLLTPMRRWLAAYWAFALDDPKVIDWCRSVLE